MSGTVPGMRQLFLDTETTGREVSQGHRIIEIGIVEMVDRRITGEHWHTRLDPERDIEAEAQQVHGISREDLAGAPRFAEVAAGLLEFVAGAEVIIHNAPFDLGFLDSELARLGRSPFSQHCGRVVDSLRLARSKRSGPCSLDALCRHFQVDNSNRQLHGALLDAELLAQVYLRLTGGQISISLRQERIAATMEPLPDPRPRLPVPLPDGEELEGHRAMLASIRKASGGTCLWPEAPTPGIS